MDILDQVRVANDFIDRALQAHNNDDKEQEAKFLQIALDNIRMVQRQVKEREERHDASE